jgi:hypothetical protein
VYAAGQLSEITFITDYNAAQALGSTLTLDFGINFPGSEAPEVVAIYINDKPICSGGNGGGGGGGQTTPAP